jgi:hypothetical protein
MTQAQSIEELEKTVLILAETLRIFGDPFNWESDTTWSPDVVAVQAELPSELATKALERCGL